MIAILLAAGRGRKFWPYADVRNKCAFPVANVPVVRRLAEQLLEAGAEGLIVVTGHRAASVRAALAGLETRVRFVEQSKPEGTADAVFTALGDDEPERFVVVSADALTTTATIRALMAAANGDSPTAVVQPLNGERPGDWITGVVRNGAVEEIQGHGREGEVRLPGLYALGRECLPYLRANPGVMTHVPVGGMPPLESEIAESLALMSDAGIPVRAIQADGFLVDLDKPWHILEANRLLLGERFAGLPADVIDPSARVAESAEINGRLILEPGAVIGERVVVRGDLWLGPGASVTNGAIIGGRCALGRGGKVRDYALLGENTTLGPETICGHGAEFEGVALEGAYLYHYCEIYGVLGARVDIGAATVCGTLRFDDGVATHRIGDRRETPPEGGNASYLGDYSRTGVNAILMPGVRTGAYSCVGPGVVMSEDLPANEMVTVRQDLVRRPWGPERYGW